MTLRRAVVLAMLLALAGCRGPKSTPEGTVDSFFDSYDAHDADALVQMTLPSFVAKHGSDKVRQFYWDNIWGIQSIEATKNISITGKDTAQAQCEMTGVWRLRGQNPEDFDTEISLLLHLIGGKWYVEPPGTSRVQPW
jgi:hypothetical protein